MNIGIDDLKSNSCMIGLLWDNVYVGFPVTADVDSKVMAQIKDAMEKDNRPYVHLLNIMWIMEKI